MTQTCVAVYGSLKRGFCNHHFLDGCTRLGEFYTRPEYTLVDLGDYPGLIPYGRTAVQVEIYRVSVSDLLLLDELEDVPHEYVRTTAHIPGFGEALLYMLSDTFIERLKPYERRIIPSGCWVGRK